MHGGPPPLAGFDVRALVALFARELAPLVAEELARTSGQRVADAAPLVCKQELARVLSVSTPTVDRLTRDGVIPFVRVGDSRRYDVAAVRAALEARTAAEPKALPASSTPPTLTGGVRRVSRGSR